MLCLFLNKLAPKLYNKKGKTKKYEVGARMRKYIDILKKYDDDDLCCINTLHAILPAFLYITTPWCFVINTLASCCLRHTSER